MKRRRLVTFILVPVLLGALALAWPALASEKKSEPEWKTLSAPYKGYQQGWAVISVEGLKQLMDQQEAWDNQDSIEKNLVPKKDPKLVIIDVGKPTEHYRAEGHIPGAFNIWRPDYESDEKLFGVRGENLMSREDFQNFLRGFGIDRDSQVIWYDHKYDATRLWWACMLYGFETRVLDGGFKAWKNAGYDVDRLGSPDKPNKPGNVVLKGGVPEIRVDTDAVWKCKDDPKWDLWDIRSQEELDGTRVRAKRMGGIAWSKAMLPWRMVHGEDGTLLNAKEMRAFIEEHGFHPSHRNVFFCQSGVRVTQTFFALYLVGFPLEHLHIYDSSWIYWGNAPDTPIVDTEGKPVPYPEE